MTKYYYNNQLIRSSKSDREYKFALLRVKNDGSYRCYKCSASYDACVRELDYITKGETIAKQTGKTMDEVWNGGYHLSSDQFHHREQFIVVELEKK